MSKPGRSGSKPFRGLSGRLLLATVLFVMVAEVLIFVPSLARFRTDYYDNRLALGHAAGVAFLAAPADRIPDELREEVLDSAGLRSIVLHRGGARMLVVEDPATPMASRTVEPHGEMIVDRLSRAFMCLVPEATGTVERVIGAPTVAPHAVVEVTMDKAMLRKAMVDYALRILGLSLVISFITGALVYLTMTVALVRPIRRVIESMTGFRADPERAALIDASARGTEIGEAERELAAMQAELRGALAQKTRLAALGEAVAKVNHDLRNILASAQLLADRLDSSSDPLVRRLAPKLIRSIDRASALCANTLRFGSASEPPPERRSVALPALLEEVREALLPEERGDLGVEISAPEDATVEADPDQLFRILLNLARNAAQAIETTGAMGRIELAARRGDGGAVIDVSDDGPGLPSAARDNLFKAFRGAARKGGTGLGLAIAQELARGHGGDVALVHSTTKGTLFRVTIPDRG